jgi:uncharacterized membrane protein YqjE
MKRDDMRKLFGLIVVIAIVIVVMNPGVWIISIGTLIHIAVLYAVANIVCRILFGKSLRDYIFENRR